MEELTENQIDQLSEILEQRFNYEKIRQNAVRVYNQTSKNRIDGISEKCSVIFNPVRQQLFLYAYDEGIEMYFDIEYIDLELPTEEAILYKKAFVSSFTYLLQNRLLCLW